MNLPQTLALTGTGRGFVTHSRDPHTHFRRQGLLRPFGRAELVRPHLRANDQDAAATSAMSEGHVGGFYV
jgi:hypothetical protein